MTVSKIASKIYQAAKAAAKGVWNWRLEWSKAMKKAVKQLITTGENEMNDLTQAAKNAMEKLAEIDAEAAKEIATHYLENEAATEGPAEIKVTVETEVYNQRRYGRPWIATVGFASGARGDFEFGEWIGDHRNGTAGMLEITAKPGAVIATGQKDHRNSRNSAPDFHILLEDGSLERCSKVEAKQHWDSINK